MNRLTPLLLLFCCAFIIAPPMDTSPLTVTIQTPHPGYAIDIQRVDLGEEHLNVLVNVNSPPKDRMYPSVISEASATVQLRMAQPSLPVKVYVVNRSWGWGDETAVKDEAAYTAAIGKATAVGFAP